MSKYGLPKGLRIRWCKPEKPSGPYASFFERGGWQAVLKAEGKSFDGKLLCFASKAGGQWAGWACMRSGPNRRFKARWDTEDEAKAALDYWLTKHPEHWEQFVE